jgi:hypothetical protein
MNPALRAFLFGALGSVSVEVIKILSYYQTGGTFPKRYQSKGYWVTRVLLVFIGGALAVAYGVQSDIVAVHVGASTPAIIGTFAKEPPKV